MEDKKKELNWLMNKMENCSDRYMEAEKFLIELAQLKWYQKFFLTRKIIRFLDSRKKYKF
jgi:hypothetical protein